VPEQPPRTTEDGHVGPVVASVVPRFAGPATFARLPRLDDVDVDVAVVGVPFDGGVGYRPGARFGPAHVRESSRLLRPYNPAQEVAPFGRQQVADAGDLAVNPFSIEEAVRQIEAGADELLERSGRLLTIGGDHTIALPLLRSVARRLLSRELLTILGGFAGLRLVGADVVEVAPAYDHAEITGIAASHVAYELLSAMALTPPAP
jgi:agmatinase